MRSKLARRCSKATWSLQNSTGHCGTLPESPTESGNHSKIGQHRRNFYSPHIQGKSTDIWWFFFGPHLCNKSFCKRTQIVFKVRRRKSKVMLLHLGASSNNEITSQTRTKASLRKTWCFMDFWWKSGGTRKFRNFQHFTPRPWVPQAGQGPCQRCF